ncbi:MAG: cell wall anchor protein [Muribaculaceae bacterium]|nr:cell wall anchor protein [Muribaculaceae bacterium]
MSAACMQAAPSVSVTAKLDSAYILMGKQTQLHMQTVQPADVVGHWTLPADAKMLTPEVYLIARSDADTTDLGNNRIQIDQSLIVQSFDSGLYVLPPLQYVIGADTFASSSLALKVIPVEVDTMQSIHPYANTVSIPRKIWDFLPDFIVDYWSWYLTAIILISAVTVYWFFFRKKNIKRIFMPEPKPVPPYEMAMQQLQSLKDSQLCERGQEKEYYTRLTDILRVYLQRRFGINAMEMTTPQIQRAVRENKETCSSTKYMNQILEIADFVKFAKVRPLPDDNVKSFNSALRFVEDTKPLPEPTEATEEDKSNENKEGNK